MNPLPPQAYTKETLLKAYSWVMNQNASIKDMASTPDILVSLYLKATRDGESALDRPSILNFKKELKSLAGMMGELDRGMPLAESAQLSGSYDFLNAQNPPATNPGPPFQATLADAKANTMANANPSEARSTPKTEIKQLPVFNEMRSETRTENRPESKTEARDLKSQLDPMSQAMIHEVKLAFNLSSDLESLRMLIKIGYTRAQLLIK